MDLRGCARLPGLAAAGRGALGQLHSDPSAQSSQQRVSLLVTTGLRSLCGPAPGGPRVPALALQAAPFRL